MPNPHVTFVGLRVVGAPAKRMHAYARALASQDPVLRVPALEDLHLTVQYLGPTPPDDIEPVSQALAAAVANVPPLQLAFEGLGAFPHARRPRVIWAGVVDRTGDDALARLERQVGSALGPIGYEPESRPFHPHVTLARVRGRPRPRTLEGLQRQSPEVWGSQTVSEVNLIVSRPGQRPYHYRNLTTIELSSRGSEPTPS